MKGLELMLIDIALALLALLPLAATRPPTARAVPVNAGRPGLDFGTWEVPNAARKSVGLET